MSKLVRLRLRTLRVYSRVVIVSQRPTPDTANNNHTVTYYRHYASVKDKPESEEDYEIDLVTLKKRYKANPSSPPPPPPSASFPSSSSTSSPTPPTQQPQKGSSAEPQTKPIDPMVAQFEEELKLLRHFISHNPSLNEVFSFNRTRLNPKMIENLLTKFKTSFFKDYLSNQAKCDVTKVFQMCNYLQKNEALFNKLFVKDETEAMNDILKVFSKPLKKRSASATLHADVKSAKPDPDSHLKEMIDRHEVSEPVVIDPADVKETSKAEAKKSDETNRKRRNSFTFDHESAAKLAKLTQKKNIDKASKLENEIKTRSIDYNNRKDDLSFLSKFMKDVTNSSPMETSTSSKTTTIETDKASADDANLQKLTAAAIRDKYAKLYATNSNATKEKPEVKDRQIEQQQQQKPLAQKEELSNATRDQPLESIEDFLKKAKATNEINKEQNFRRQKAYEWSKSQLNDNVLEKGKFFSPRLIPGTLIPFNVLNPFGRSSNDLLFPTLNKKNQRREYLLVTPSGKTIRCGYENPLGFNFIPRDVFSILNSLENPERFIRHINKLSRKNWKLIGGGDDKLLVFARVSGPRYVWNWVKNLFTLIGMLSTGLVVGSFFIKDENSQFKHLKRIEQVTAGNPVTGEAV